MCTRMSSGLLLYQRRWCRFSEDGPLAGIMDKCTMCAGGPVETNSKEERDLYGQNRIAEGKVPICAAVCATNALLVGDADEVYSIYKKRLAARDKTV